MGIGFLTYARPRLPWLTRRRMMLLCLLAALASFAPYSVAAIRLDHSPAAVAGRLAHFSRDNDVNAILDAACHVTASDVRDWFTTPRWIDHLGGGPFWRPLVSVLWWGEYALWGRDIALWVIVTGLLVSLSAMLLAGTASTFTGSRLAGVAAAGFLVWKVQYQLPGILDWFPAQTDVLAATWLLAGGYCLVLGLQAEGRRQALLLALSVLWYALAVLSKESVLPFPLVAWAMLWLRLRRRALPWMAAHAVTFALLLLARTLILGSLGHFFVSFTPVLLVRRAVNALFGVWLHYEYCGWEALGALAVAGAVLLVVVRPDLLRQRYIGYPALAAWLLLMALLARATLGSALALAEPRTWGRLADGAWFLLCMVLLVRRRPGEFLVVSAAVFAGTVQIVVIRYWLDHYFYLAALGWAAMDALVVTALWEWWHRRREPAIPSPPGRGPG